MRVRNFTVDHLNRTTAEEWMDGATVVNTISTAYNADGEVTSAGDSYSNYAFGYDGQGHLASVDNAGTPGVPDVVLAGQFDGQGDRTSLSATIAGVKDFLNSYSYDTLSRLTSIEQQGQTGGNAVNPKTIDFGYDGIGDITQIYRMNSVGMGPNPQSDPADTAIGYNSLAQLTAITPSHNGVNIDPLSWTFDTLDRAATFTNDDGTATYGYNLDSELTSVSYTGATEPPDENYSFDPNGNQDEAGHVVSPANQVTNDGTFTYAFDNEGNRTSRTRISSDYATDHTVTYSWDYRDRLTDVEYFGNNSVLTKHVHYVYGVFDHLIETDVDPTGGGTYTIITHNIYDLAKPVVTAEDSTQPVEPGLMISAAGDVVLQTGSSQQVTERVLNGPVTSAYDAFFTALAQDDVPSGESYWFLLNNQGSFMDAVDANGNQVDHAVYTAFGELHGETNSAIPHIAGYAGGMPDTNTGLVNFLHRWYDPTAAVWLSIDPSGFRAGDGNLSRYVQNNAPNQTDNTGLADRGFWNKTKQALGGIWEIGPWDAWQAGFGADEDAAVEFSEEYEGQWMQNAARHGVWQCRLAKKYGAEKAKAIGDLHELGDEDSVDSRVDQFNNAVARELAEEAEDLDDIPELIRDAIESGDLITDPDDPRIPGGPGGGCADNTGTRSGSSNSSDDSSGSDSSSGSSRPWRWFF